MASGDYYGKKGYIRRLENKSWAEIKILESGDVVKVHQSFISPIVPVILF